MKSLDHKALQEACREVAKSTLWLKPDPQWLEDIIDRDQIENAVAAYYQLAERLAKFVEQAGGDPNFVTRAVSYLTYERAIPPMSDDTRWLQESLEVLVGVYQPTSAPRREDSVLMRELEDAARRNRVEAERDADLA